MNRNLQSLLLEPLSVHRNEPVLEQVIPYFRNALHGNIPTG